MFEYVAKMREAEEDESKRAASEHDGIKVRGRARSEACYKVCPQAADEKKREREKKKKR